MELSNIYKEFKSNLGMIYIINTSENQVEVAKAITEGRLEDAQEGSPYEEERFVELMEGDYGLLSCDDNYSLDESLLE